MQDVFGGAPLTRGRCVFVTLCSLFSLRWQRGERQWGPRGAVNRFIEGYLVIPHTQWDCSALYRAQIFLPSLPFLSACVFLAYGTESSAPIIYSRFMFWWTHRVFPFVMSFCAQIKLGIMLYLSTMKPCHSALHDNIKCHVRVHLQNKITAFGGPLNSCCTLHLMYYARGKSADCCRVHCWMTYFLSEYTEH